MKRNVLFAVALAFAAPLLSASSLAELGTRHQTLAGGEEVEVRFLALAPLESGAPLEEPDRTAALQDLFPTADTARIQKLFTAARWDFHAAGTFQMIPGDAPVAEALSLEGTYRRLPGAIEVHAARKIGSIGLAVSLDGILRESEEGYRLEAVYHLRMSLTSHWLAEVRQTIRPGVPPPPEEPSVTWIDGIPVPAMFEVTLRGQTDGRDLPPATGFVSIFHPGEEHVGPFAIDLYAAVPEGGQGAGELFWPAPPAGTEPSRARFSTQDGSVSIEVQPRPGTMFAPYWIAPMPVASLGLKELLQIARWGRLELTVRGDELSGRVQAEQEGGVRYEGRLTGKRCLLRLPTGHPVATDRPDTGVDSIPSDLAGSWRIEDGGGREQGELLLIRDEEGGVRGKITSADSAELLAGREEEGFVILAETAESNSLWRFRLLTENDVLAGFVYRPDRASIQTLIGRRIAPRDPPSEGRPAAREDLRERLLQGIDLAAQSRCPEAIPLLEDALTGLPRAAGEEEEILLRAQRALDFLGTDMAARALAICDLAVGDYDGFLRHLRQATEALRPFRQLERQAVVDSIQWVRGGLVEHRARLAEFEAQLAGLCQSPPAGSGLAAAVAGAHAEVAALGEAFDAGLADLEELRAELSERNLSSREGFAGLESLRQGLREEVRGSFTRLAAASQKIARQDSRFMAARDRLWTNTDRFGEFLRPVVEEPLYSLAQAIFEAPLAARPEGDLATLLVLVGDTLLWSDLALREEMDSLTYVRNIPLAVEVASQVAIQPERWRTRLATDRGKIAALGRLEPLFADLILLLLEEGEVSDALAVSEIARSRAFVDLLAGRDEIRQYLDELSGRSDDGVLPSPTAVAPPAIEDVLETVRRRGSTTVEYFLAEDRVVIWVVSPEGKVFAASEPIDRAALRSAIDELHAQLEGRSRIDGGSAPPDAVRTRQLLRELHRLLIDPIPPDRLPQTAEEALTIIPHQELFAVPFAALEDEQGRRLIERHPIVYGTSIASLGAIRRNRSGRRAEAPLRLLALVNPSPLPGRPDGGTFPPLDKLEQGFSRIAEIYPAPERMVLTREAATLEALRAHAAGAGVLHLVTHAEFVEQDPLASFIALAGEDGTLRVPDVFRLNLSADLVILWACETGRGGLSADGVEGLSRGFTWAGASSLLLSLWEIPDTESLVQMEGFHHFWLRQGFSKARALQKAQVEYSRLYPDQPGLWAGLVLYGEAE